MKITIQYDDVTSSIEFGEFDLHEFRDHLRGLLYTVWLPCQVDQIIPDEEALDNSAPRRMDALTEAVQKAGLYTDSKQKEEQ